MAGYLYFLPIIGSEPIRWRMPVLDRYLLLVTRPVDTVVGVVLMLAPHELSPPTPGPGGPGAPSLVTDLHEGGLIMLGGSDLIMAVLAIILAVSFIRTGEAVVPADLGAYNAYLAALDKSPRPSGLSP